MKTCRVKPEGNFDAFILEVQTNRDGFLEILDRSGKLPLDAFDEINEALEFEDDSGRVHSKERDQHYAWEILDSDEHKCHQCDDIMVGQVHLGKVQYVCRRCQS